MSHSRPPGATASPAVRCAGALALLVLARATLADDLTLHLEGAGPVTRNVVDYRCDRIGSALGLPAGRFSVEYINGAGNSLAILPVEGRSLIFVSVISGSGARYAAQRYIWWEAAGRSITFSADTLAGQTQSVCHRLSGTS